MGDSPQCAIASESWSNILSLASSEAIAAGMLVHGSTPSSGQKLPARPQKIRKIDPSYEVSLGSWCGAVPSYVLLSSLL